MLEDQISNTAQVCVCTTSTETINQVCVCSKTRRQEDDMQPLVPTLKAHLRVLNQSFSPFHVRHRRRCNHSHQTCSQLKLQHCSAARLTAYLATVIYAVLTALPQRNELVNVCALFNKCCNKLFTARSIPSLQIDRVQFVCGQTVVCPLWPLNNNMHFIHLRSLSLSLSFSLVMCSKHTIDFHSLNLCLSYYPHRIVWCISININNNRHCGDFPIPRICWCVFLLHSSTCNVNTYTQPEYVSSGGNVDIKRQTFRARLRHSIKFLRTASPL